VLVSVLSLVLLAVCNMGVNDETMQRCWVDFTKATPAAGVEVDMYPGEYADELTVDLEFETKAALDTWIIFLWRDCTGGLPGYGVIVWMTPVSFWMEAWGPGGIYGGPLWHVIQVNTHYFFRLTYGGGTCRWILNESTGVWLAWLPGTMTEPAASVCCSRSCPVGTYENGASLKLYQARIAYTKLDQTKFNQDGYGFEADSADVARYLINEGAGDVLGDTSGRGNDGQIVGAPAWMWGCGDIPCGESERDVR
jgi:hypothetical protein